MNEKFTKPEITPIDHSALTIDVVEEQIKSMKLGYIAHAFVLKDMAEEFERFFKKNFDEYDEKTIEKAEKHALKQLEDPEYYNGEVMKTVDEKTAQCFQRMLMINQKRDDLMAKEAEVAIARKNITWLEELKDKMIGDNLATTPKGSQD